MAVSDDQNDMVCQEHQTAFLATISHEIRTPLNAIWGMSQLLGDTQLDETQKQFVDTIEKAGSHLLSMIDNLLDVAKLRAGELVLKPEAVDVDDELRIAAAEVQGLLEEKGLSFVIQTSPKLAGSKLIDRRRLRQCLANLLGNAAKFTVKGGVELSAIALEDTGAQDGKLVITVRDSGPGIPAAKQESIFDLFLQGEGGITRSFDGAGLGLPVTRLLAQLMGGDLSLSSQPGVGSSFVLTLEYGKVAKSEAPRRSESANILVVEDNRTNQRLICMVLEKLGHKCTIAENGAEGVRQFKTQDFDLVLMDLHMPVMDGFECTAAIRRSGHKNADVPIIALTADVRPGIEERVAEQGMDGYLSKPFELPELDRIIRAALMLKNVAAEVSQADHIRTG